MTRELDIQHALKHYGLGAVPACETCHVAAVIDRETPTLIICEVLPVRASQFTKAVEFLRSSVNYEYYSANSALIEIPKTYLPIFVLWAYVLPESFMQPLRSRITMHNAPYLKGNSSRTERIGSVRI